MLKPSFSFILFLLMKCSLEIAAQTTPELILPEVLYGTVKLNMSTIPNQNKEIPGYNDLAVFVRNEAEVYGSNAIQGRHERDGDYLVFKPYFPFESGMTYVVRTRNADLDHNYSYQAFQIGKKKIVPKAEIVSIYPSANQLPENLLRIYIYFNTPMKRGQALKHIQLIDDKGNIDNHAFMELKQELWSADGKRLTLLFDPGRIKRGVSTNMLRGPALIAGKRYRLSISETWQDVHGQHLSSKSVKEIEVVKAYRRHLRVNEWVIDKPKANSYDLLTIRFDRIVDHALIQSMFRLEDSKKNPIAGHWEILEHEQLLQFIPVEKWHRGAYNIVIDSRLEDVTGNNLQNLLDHNKTDKENNSDTHQFIDFKI